MMNKKLLIFLLFLCFTKFGFSSETGRAFFDTGMKYYNELNFIAAESYFQKAFDSGMQDSELYFYLGNTYLPLHQYKKASNYYEQGLRLTTDTKLRSTFLHNLGYVSYLLGDYRLSTSYFDQAYGANTGLVNTFWYKGLAYYHLGDKENVIREWQNYLQASPNGKQSDNIRRFLALLKDAPLSALDEEELKDPNEEIAAIVAAALAAAGVANNQAKTQNINNENNTNNQTVIQSQSAPPWNPGEDSYDFEFQDANIDELQKGKVVDFSFEELLE